MGLFALAFAVFYCSFPLRALRWKALLGNVGYDRAAGRPIPSTFGLTRIIYIAWFTNCVTVARLGDAYRGYLLKKASGVSFAVTLGTVLAERLPGGRRGNRQTERTLAWFVGGKRGVPGGLHHRPRL